MHILQKLSATVAGGLFLGLTTMTGAQAGGYGAQTYAQPATKTYTRSYTKHVTPQRSVPKGEYCLHEPGDSYGLSYGGGCNYDGGYGGQQTTINVRGGNTIYNGGGVILRGGGVRSGGGRVYRGFKH